MGECQQNVSHSRAGWTRYMIHVQIILMGFGQSAGDADAGIKTGRIITNDDQNYSYYPCVPEGIKTLGGKLRRWRRTDPVRDVEPSSRSRRHSVVSSRRRPGNGWGVIWFGKINRVESRLI